VILDSLRVFPAEFFGGDLAEVSPGKEVWDYSRIKSLEEFKEIAAPASVIFTVDWASGGMNCAYGRSTLERIAASAHSEMIGTVVFGIDVDTDQVELLLAAVMNTKGWAEWNGKIIHPK
jgi:hypothetical protein